MRNSKVINFMKNSKVNNFIRNWLKLFLELEWLCPVNEFIMFILDLTYENQGYIDHAVMNS